MAVVPADDVPTPRPAAVPVHRPKVAPAAVRRMPQRGGMDEDPEDIPTACPMPCTYCTEPGSCEDCLDCLCWPDVVDDSAGAHPAARRLPSGPSVPTMGRQLALARAQLDLGARLGLVVRRYRRAHAMSQRELADHLGWHCSTLSRAERDASSLTVRKAQQILRHVGYRLAIVPDTPAAGRSLGEDPDTVWDVTDLVARDGGGRRLPPFGTATWNDEIDRRLYGPIRKHESEWTWHRPSA